MTYATLPDMIAEYGEQKIVQLTDRSRPRLNAVDEAVLGRALADADAEINGYLEVRYPLPLTAVSPDLVRNACYIAYFRLFKDTVPPEVRTAYEDAVSWLNKVSAGRVRLVGLSVESAQPVAAGRVIVSGEARAFSRKSLEGY